MRDYLNDVSDYAALVVDLKKKIDQQQQLISKLQGQIKIQNAMKIPVTVAVQIADLTNKVESLQNEISRYKPYVPRLVVEEQEQKNKPARGSLSKSLKTTK